MPHLRGWSFVLLCSALATLAFAPALALAQAPPPPPNAAPELAPPAEPAPLAPTAAALAPAPVAAEPAAGAEPIVPTAAAPVATAAASPLTAPPQPASWRLMLSDLTIFRMNPLGLETRARFGLQKRLYASPSALTANNFAFVGLTAKLNPAAAYVAAAAEVQPASIFNLRASVGVQHYFKTLGFLQSFSSPNANYSDQSLDDNEDSAQRTQLLQATLQPMLQLRFGPLALRSMFQFDYWSLDIRDGDTAAYEVTLDTLIPDGGWTLSSDSDLLYVGHPGLAVGLRHSWVHPFYDSESFSDAADEDRYDGDNAHQRLGLFAAYTFRDRGPSTFNKPTVILIASWYLSHRFRTGEPDSFPTGGRADDYTSRAVPYFVLGFAFESDFLPARY